MSISIGRLGYLGLGIESNAGDAVGAAIYLQYTENSMRGHHEPIEISASKAARVMDKNSVVGKKWGEGDIAIFADIRSSGYLWKLALGNEALATGTPNNHTFYTTVSGNTPKTATLIYGRGTDVEQYVYSAIDELNMEVSDGLVAMSASIQSKFPTNQAAQTFTTTSGTYLSFKDMSVKFGANLSAANGGSATAINDLSVTIANNLETIHRSGSSDVSVIRNKGLRVSGSYTLYFESTADKNAYYNLEKRAMEIIFTGNTNEQMRIRVPRFRLDEGEISTGLDDFFVISANWVAEDFVDSGVRLVDVRLISQTFIK
jgi:hypothetical protein